MRKIIGLLSMVMILSLAQTTNAKGKNEIKEVTFITSIDCNHCKMTIMKNIPYEKGVKDVKVDVEKKEVTVKYLTDKNNEANLVKAIEKLGYTAEVKGHEKCNKPCCATVKQCDNK